MFILIKNNLKLMLRSKWILFFLTILPVIVIGLLSNIFNDMLNKDYSIDGINVGYSITSNSDEFNNFDVFKDSCKDNNIKLSEYQNADFENLINNEVVDVFVDINDGKYSVYTSKEKENEAYVIESMFSSYFFSLSNQKIITDNLKNVPLEIVKNDDTSNVNNNDSFVTSEKVDYEKMASAIDYYGIIEIVFFAWCGMISLAAVISSERKNNIHSRFVVSGLSKIKLYFAKLIPCFLATIIETAIAIFLSVIFYKIHWGNILCSAGILLLLALTASAVGIVLFYVFKHTAASIIVGFAMVYIIGFLGGTFQTYMLSNIPINLVKMSPQYYINRTLVEFSTKGSSDYAYTCIVYLLIILIVSMLFGIILMNRKKEAK